MNDAKPLGAQRQLPAARPVRLAEMIDFGLGAVVSRTLLKNAAGNLTLFAFAAGEGLSEHTAPFDAVVQILEGEAELTIGGVPIRASAGDTVLMPANVAHAVHAATPFKMLLIMIRG